MGNGRLALERLPEVRPDIVLCDIIMPEKDGYEVCEQIKSNPASSHLPVLLLTGAFEPFDQERAARAGYDGSLAKPFEPETLIAKVKDLLARAPSRPAACRAGRGRLRGRHRRRSCLSRGRLRSAPPVRGRSSAARRSAPASSRTSRSLRSTSRLASRRPAPKPAAASASPPLAALSDEESAMLLDASGRARVRGRRVHGHVPARRPALVGAGAHGSAECAAVGAPGAAGAGRGGAAGAGSRVAAARAEGRARAGARARDAGADPACGRRAAGVRGRARRGPRLRARRASSPSRRPRPRRRDAVRARAGASSARAAAGARTGPGCRAIRSRGGARLEPRRPGERAVSRGDARCGAVFRRGVAGRGRARALRRAGAFRGLPPAVPGGSRADADAGAAAGSAARSDAGAGAAAEARARRGA